MSVKTGISWTDATWNPIRGCSRVSEGCRHCYAERQAERIVRMGKGNPTGYDGLIRIGRIPSSSDGAAAGSHDDPSQIAGPHGGKLTFTFGSEPRWTGVVRFVAERLADPLRWRKPRRIFVNSMSDLFHESLTNQQIAAVFGVMAACQQHTFQVLTKRAKRMLEWSEWVMDKHYPRPGQPFDPTMHVRDVIFRAAMASLNGFEVGLPNRFDSLWPLPNVHLGVSVENQAAADERIPELLATPAAVRWLSCEPLLSALDLDRPRCDNANHGAEEWSTGDDGAPWCNECDAERSYGHWLSADGGIDWVVAGCESGPCTRPCDVSWLRSLRDQCAAAGVPFWLKQASEEHGTSVYPSARAARPEIVASGPGSKRKPGGVIELPYLDGVQHAAVPETPSRSRSRIND